MRHSEKLILDFARRIKYFRLNQIIEKLGLPPLTVRQSIKSLLTQNKIKKFNSWTYTINE